MRKNTEAPVSSGATDRSVEAPVMGVERCGGVVPTENVRQPVRREERTSAVKPFGIHPDSYGYRPGKSALQAVGVTRQRCWESPWVVEFDIHRAFDELDHRRLMRHCAVVV
jgi:RNA-directed DNA polymerase